MKSQKGVALTSIIIYIIVMLVVIASVSLLSTFFFKNVDTVGKEINPSQEILRFNSFFVQDLNKEDIKILEAENSSDGNYVVLTDGTQYTFKNNGIYRGKVKICSDINNMQFEKINDNEINVKYKLLQSNPEVSTNYST